MRTQTPKFIPGLKLCKLFYQQEVRPILRNEFPQLRYSAALIGWGSEVLGFDTPLSCDHHWGPRVLLFLNDEDSPKFSDKISQALSDNLPYDFLGYSTNFGTPDPGGVRHPLKIKHGPVDHMIETYPLAGFLKSRLGFDPSKKIELIDWLIAPQQKLLEIVSGEVYHDGLGLRKIQKKLAFYPREIWLYMLAAQWAKIAQEEAFVGRAGDAGDELGSAIVAARMVRELMKLAFLMEKQYAPYSKWFGTAFSKLRIAPKLMPVLREVLTAKTWKARERKLAQAYEIVARQHNALKITKPLPTKATKYYGRPYLVIHADAFMGSLLQTIRDPELMRTIIPNIGSIDQFVDSHDVLQQVSLARRLRVLYPPPSEPA